VFAGSTGAPPANAGPEAPHRPPPPVFALSAPRLARPGQSGAAAAEDIAVVQTSAGIVHLTVRIVR
jgi:hypothetical protein